VVALVVQHRPPSNKGLRMTSARHVDLLDPIDMSQHLDRMELYLGQVCQIAGISKMQLDYWTNKAQIPMLIKQGKDKGLSLSAAIEAARRFKAEHGGPDGG
jgi:hypothetical protein